MSTRYEEILISAGFTRDPRREHWFHREDRKSFSFEILDDHDLDLKWLPAKLNEAVRKEEFRFYRESSDLAACHEILEQLGLSGLVAVERHG